MPNCGAVRSNSNNKCKAARKKIRCSMAKFHAADVSNIGSSGSDCCCDCDDDGGDCSFFVCFRSDSGDRSLESC